MRHIEAVTVFGWSVYGTDTIDSDVDLLVSFSNGATLLDVAGFEFDGVELRVHAVDVVSDDVPSNRIMDRIRRRGGAAGTDGSKRFQSKKTADSVPPKANPRPRSSMTSTRSLRILHA